MLDIKLSRKAKVLLKKLNEVGYMNVEEGYEAAANELLSHELVIGRNPMRNGLCGSMELTRKGRVFYLSNPSQESQVDGKWIIGIAITIIGIVVGVIFA